MCHTWHPREAYSRPIEDIVDEARKLSAQGVKELLLISQDLTYYGIDLYKRQALARAGQDVIRS